MVVRMRHNRSQRGNTRSHHALKAHSLVKCECGTLRVSHRACPNCGRYNGKVVVDLAAKAQARATRQLKKGDKKAVKEAK